MKKYGVRIVIGTDGIQTYEAAHLQREVNKWGGWYFSNKAIKEFQNIAEGNFEDFCKRNKGIGVSVKDDIVTIINDPYCTVPIYVSKYKKFIIVTSDFEEFYKKDFKVDMTGFYEILLYGSGVYDRTLLEGVKQIPAASKCVIDVKQNTYEIVPYWNFEIEENPQYENIELAVHDADRRLREIFAELNPDICMGISGGLDSRLSACMLHETQRAEDISFYTFGYNPKILEYKMAQETIRKLWKDGTKPRHIFLQLMAEDYRESEYIPVSTGAQIGLNHSHMYRCACRIKNVGETFISNYYSDAVMGWDALPEKCGESMEASDYYKKLYKNPFHLTDGLISEIKKDLKNVCHRYPINGNFTCMNEFIYVTERNPKFHVRLSATVGEFVNVEMPYADFELLNIMLSIPPCNRAEKLIEQKIINRYLGELKDISSRRYSERSSHTEERYSIGEKLFYQYGYFRMRAINALNVMLAKTTKYRLQIINPYLTENQNFILNYYLFDQVVGAVEYIKDKKIIEGAFLDSMKKKEYRSSNTGIKYTLIGLWKCFLQMEAE